MFGFEEYNFTEAEEKAIEAFCEEYDYESVEELADWLEEEFGDDLFDEDFFDCPDNEDECYSQLHQLHVCIYGEPVIETEERRRERLKDVPADVLSMFAVLDKFTSDYEEERRAERRKKHQKD